MLEVKDLHFSRGGRKLANDLHFQLKAGQCIHIAGSNGSGKSTLAAILAGDFQPDSGEVIYNGSLGVLLQDIEIDFPISVSRFIQMGKKNVDITEVLIKLDLSELADKAITELSVGQLQRVELAQLFVMNPDIWILDEPFSAQDVINTELLIDLLTELKEAGKALLLINHINLPLKNLVDQIIYLD